MKSFYWQFWVSRQFLEGKQRTQYTQCEAALWCVRYLESDTYDDNIWNIHINQANSLKSYRQTNYPIVRIYFMDIIMDIDFHIAHKIIVSNCICALSFIFYFFPYFPFRFVYFNQYTHTLTLSHRFFCWNLHIFEFKIFNVVS